MNAKEQLEEATFRPKSKQEARPIPNPVFVSDGNIPEEEDVSEVTLDLNGHYNNGSVPIAAKHSKNAYYVRCSTSPSNMGMLLNPYDIYFKESDLEGDNRMRGEQKYEFIRVSPLVFRLYKKFLNTRSETYLREAERELLNDG